MSKTKYAQFYSAYVGHSNPELTPDTQSPWVPQRGQVSYGEMIGISDYMEKILPDSKAIAAALT